MLAFSVTLPPTPSCPLLAPPYLFRWPVCGKLLVELSSQASVGREECVSCLFPGSAAARAAVWFWHHDAISRFVLDPALSGTKPACLGLGLPSMFYVLMMSEAHLCSVSSVNVLKAGRVQYLSPRSSPNESLRPNPVTRMTFHHSTGPRIAFHNPRRVQHTLPAHAPSRTSSTGSLHLNLPALGERKLSCRNPGRFCTFPPLRCLLSPSRCHHSFPSTQLPPLASPNPSSKTLASSGAFPHRVCTRINSTLFLHPNKPPIPSANWNLFFPPSWPSSTTKTDLLSCNQNPTFSIPLSNLSSTNPRVGRPECPILRPTRLAISSPVSTRFLSTRTEENKTFSFSSSQHKSSPNRPGLRSLVRHSLSHRRQIHFLHPTRPSLTHFALPIRRQN